MVPLPSGRRAGSGVESDATPRLLCHAGGGGGRMSGRSRSFSSSPGANRAGPSPPASGRAGEHGLFGRFAESGVELGTSSRLLCPVDEVDGGRSGGFRRCRSRFREVGVGSFPPFPSLSGGESGTWPVPGGSDPFPRPPGPVGEVGGTAWELLLLEVGTGSFPPSPCPSGRESGTWPVPEISGLGPGRLCDQETLLALPVSSLAVP